MATARPIAREAGETTGLTSRSYYIDRIRVVITALVVLHHTAITYGAPGGWYYKELPNTIPSLTGVLFIFFVSFNQAYFMGFFFLLAGYFTPASYNRKGPGKFLADRLIRLGIPLAVYGVPSTRLPTPSRGPGADRRRRRSRFWLIWCAESLPLTGTADRFGSRKLCSFFRPCTSFGANGAANSPGCLTLRFPLLSAGSSPRSESVGLPCSFVNGFQWVKISLNFSSVISRHIYSSSPSAL